MKREHHVRLVSKRPSAAQISNFQIKLESTTDIIDRLLLAPRQAPWKATGPSGNGTDTGTDTTTDITTTTEL
jgi:hypothetical protein